MDKKDEPVAAAKTRGAPLRPARKDELATVHARLMRAIDESPFYNDTFKAFEKARLSLDYMHNLHRADPAHVMHVLSGDEPVGFMISGPEYGTLWLYWSYVLPEKRRGTIAMASLRAFIDYWDNGRFHKISTYTKTGNEPATILLSRYGFKHVVTLEKHMFGEDYLLYEKELTKSLPGYDQGVASEGSLGRLKRGALKLLGLSRGA